MYEFFYQKKSALSRKLICSFVALTFSIGLVLGPASSVSAQYVSNLPQPGTMVLLSPAFAPPVLKGMTLHPENPLHFDFIVDRGQDRLSGDALKNETQKLLKYFLAAMTIPDDDSWVNLSPYEGDRIIPDMLGSTDMGKQMLEQDYLLKQLSASLTNPQEEIGKKFWDTVYKKAYEKFGTTAVPINTFNKVWIVPDRALILEEDGYVFIGETHLKVMLDEDYTSIKANLKSEKFGTKDIAQDKVEALNNVSSEVVRQVILPELEKEINEGKNFTAVRQIYHSVILAAWYKQNLKNSLLGRVYVDKSKIAGVDIGEKDLKQKVYEQYLAAFRKGVYNLIKEDYDLSTKETLPRKYFSGGLAWKEVKVTRAQGAAANSIVQDMRSKLRNDPGRYIVSYARMTEGAEATVIRERVLPEPIYYESDSTSYGSSLLLAGSEREEIGTVVSSSSILKSWTSKSKFLSSILIPAFQQAGLYERLLVALDGNSLVGVEEVVREFNNRFAKDGGIYKQWMAAKPRRIEELIEPQYQQQARQGELNGEQGIFAIAGGLSTRMDPVRSVMDKVGLINRGIWDINMGELIKRARILDLKEESFKVYKRDDSVNEKMSRDGWEAYKIIKSLNIDTNMVDYTVGDYIMWATIKGVDGRFESPTDRNKVRANKTIVIFVNDAIFPQVSEGFRKHKGYGFDYKNVIFAKLGFHESYVYGDKEKKLIPSGFRTSANHGASFQEAMLGVRGFRVNPDTGEEIKTKGSIVEELRALGVKAYIARRTNDAMLLLPDGGGYDIDTFAALYAARDKYGAKLVAEVMDNPQKSKGGLALTNDQNSPFAKFWEGNETDLPEISAKIDELNSNPEEATYYARLYIAGFLEDTVKALEVNGGLGLVVKAKRNPLTGKIEVSQEIPTGTITRLLPTVPFIRRDLFHALGVRRQTDPRAINNQQNHDFKDSKSLDQLTGVLEFISSKYGPDMADDIKTLAFPSLGKIDDELWHDVFVKRVDTVDARNIANRIGVPLGDVLTVFEKLGFERVYTDLRQKVFIIPSYYRKKLTLVKPKSLDDQYDESINGNGKKNGVNNKSASSSVGQAQEAQLATVVGKTTVLVIEKGSMIRKVLSNAFRAAGYGKFEIFETLEKAQQSLDSGLRPDVIVADTVGNIKALKNITGLKYLFASQETLDGQEANELKVRDGIKHRSKANTQSAADLVQAIGTEILAIQSTAAVDANVQKLEGNVPTVLRLGDLTTGEDRAFTVNVDGRIYKFAAEVPREGVDQKVLNITVIPEELESTVGPELRTFILKDGSFVQDDKVSNDVWKFGQLRVEVLGRDVVLTLIKGEKAEVVYAASSTIADSLNKEIGQFALTAAADQRVVKKALTASADINQFQYSAQLYKNSSGAEFTVLRVFSEDRQLVDFAILDGNVQDLSFLAEGGFTMVFRISGGKLIKVVKNNVGIVGKEQYRINTQEREKLAQLTKEYTDRIRGVVASNLTIPDFDAQRGNIGTTEVLGESYFKMISERSDFATTQWSDQVEESMLAAINAANRELDLTFDGSGTRADGWQVQVDSNFGNFLFDAKSGELVAWIDPIVIIPPTQNIIESVAAAPAVASAGVTDRNVGGIDFDPSLLNLQIKRNGKGVPLPLPQQNLENINIDGLYPVIINMQPATIQNFPFLISADKQDKVPELSMR